MSIQLNTIEFNGARSQCEQTHADYSRGQLQLKHPIYNILWMILSPQIEVDDVLLHDLLRSSVITD